MEEKTVERCSFCGKQKHEVQSLVAGGKGAYICNECISLSAAMVRDDTANTETAPELVVPKKIVEVLEKYVIGQDEAKKTLAVAVYNHYKRLQHVGKEGSVEISKSNVLLIGPTGSGKTLLAQTLAQLLKVPFTIADATTLTEAGYVGEDVEHIIQKLLQKANGDIKLAEKGIIYIDEIDKIARKSDNPSITRDVSGEGVQQALLKIIEGTTSSVPPTGKRKHPNTDFLQIKTDNILFICGGAFDGLEKVIGQRNKRGSMGFGAEVSVTRDGLISDVEPDDLVKFGLIPELIGRLPVVVTLDQLDHDALSSILTQPQNALVKQYQALLEMDDVELEITPAAIRAIADQAIKHKTGARGLRTVIEKILQPVMFEVPGEDSVKKVIISEDCVTEGAAPHYVATQEDSSA